MFQLFSTQLDANDINKNLILSLPDPETQYFNQKEHFGKMLECKEVDEYNYNKNDCKHLNRSL